MSRDHVESRYLTLFEDSPIALWEEDFSGVKEYLSKLRESGVTDFQKYFKEHPEELRKCADFVQIKRVNKATLLLQGVDSEEELIGSLGKILVEDAMEVFLGEVLAIAEGKQKFESTVTLSTLTGEKRHILLILSVPEEFRESLEMVIISMLDITESVEAKAALEEALKTAAFYNDLMAHDLSNMHQGIVSSMELLLQRKELPEDLKSLVEAALLQSQRGAAIIRQVKKLASIAANERELKPIDPYISLVAAMEMADASFPHKETIFETNLKKEEHLVCADEFLVDAFYNLFHNSIQHDISSRVNIVVHVEPKDAQFLQFRVMDKGPGIKDQEKQELLTFPRKLGRPGGIGLTLVTRIIERYGGKIHVEDRVAGDHSKGVCFVFTIPLCSK